MKRIDLISLAFLFMAVMAIFYPVLYSEYLYSDEAPQLWLAQKGINLTSIPQGRYITYKLFTALFSPVKTVHAVMYTRLLALFGWMACLPAWYYIIKKLVVHNNMAPVLVLLSMVYLVSMPGFAISIGWASCLELFIAYTCGLVSGYALYNGTKMENGRLHISAVGSILSMLFGLASLFTYQHGFGCFFIPFFIQFIAGKKFTKTIYTGIGFSLLVLGIYYLFFKYSLGAMGLAPSERGDFATNPVKKLIFLFARPLTASFHFSWLFNEKSRVGAITSIIVVLLWLILAFTKQQSKSFLERCLYLSGLTVFFVLIYLPSLVVKENYPSNRTLLALNLAVFFLVAETIFSRIKENKSQHIIAGSMVVLFLLNAWYNFNRQFIQPLTIEYSAIKNAVSRNYTGATGIVYFVQPSENAFSRQYGIVASWDEFGIPSAAKPWVPEPLIRQMIAEKTGSREIAEKVVVKMKAANEASVLPAGDSTRETIVINVAEMTRRP